MLTALRRCIRRAIGFCSKVPAALYLYTLHPMLGAAAAALLAWVYWPSR